MNAEVEWHRALAGTAGRGDPVPVYPTDRILARWPDGDFIVDVLSKQGLEAEGESMGECEGGYWPQVRDGAAAIFSYRTASGIPIAAWEIALDEGGKPVKLVQVQGPENGPVLGDPALSELEEDDMTEEQRAWRLLVQGRIAWFLKTASHAAAQMPFGTWKDQWISPSSKLHDVYRSFGLLYNPEAEARSNAMARDLSDRLDYSKALFAALDRFEMATETVRIHLSPSTIGTPRTAVAFGVEEDGTAWAFSSLKSRPDLSAIRIDYEHITFLARSFAVSESPPWKSTQEMLEPRDYLVVWVDIRTKPIRWYAQVKRSVFSDPGVPTTTKGRPKKGVVEDPIGPFPAAVKALTLIGFPVTPVSTLPALLDAYAPSESCPVEVFFAARENGLPVPDHLMARVKKGKTR